MCACVLLGPAPLSLEWKQDCFHYLVASDEGSFIRVYWKEPKSSRDGIPDNRAFHQLQQLGGSWNNASGEPGCGI